jgi:hypothetical protein
MVSPVRGDYRRCQAETPLIDLFKLADPALCKQIIGIDGSRFRTSSRQIRAAQFNFFSMQQQGMPFEVAEPQTETGDRFTKHQGARKGRLSTLMIPLS